MSYLGMSLKNPGWMNNYHFYNLFGNATEIIKVIFFKTPRPAWGTRTHLSPELPTLPPPGRLTNVLSISFSPPSSFLPAKAFQPSLHPTNGQSPAHGNPELAGSLGLYFLWHCCKQPDRKEVFLAPQMGILDIFSSTEMFSKVSWNGEHY